MSEEIGPLNLGGVSGIPQRTQSMRFSRHYWSYNPGEVAYFLVDEAEELAARGVAAALVPQAARNTGGILPNPANTLAALQLISNGSFRMTINGTEREFGLFDFTTAATLADVATTISVIMSTIATCTYAATRFTITTVATGPDARISYASAASSGTNISTHCRWTLATGAQLSQGLI